MKRSAADPDLRAALDRIVADALRPVSAGLALAFLVLGGIHGLPHADLHPHHVHWVAAGVAVASSVAMLGVRALLRRRTLSPRLAHPVGSALAGVALLNGLVELALGDADETIVFIFLVVGAGALFLSWRWLGAVLVAAGGTWLAAALPNWSDDPASWSEFGAFLAIAVAMSVGIHAVRLRSTTQLERAWERLARIAAASLDGIVEIDDRGHVTFWNEGAERLFGYAAGEVLGRKLHDLCASPEDRAAFERGFEAFRRTGGGPVVGRVVEAEAIRRDGTRVPVELSIAPLPLGGVWGAVGIVRDVTDRKRADREVRLLESLGLAIAEAPTLDEALGTTLRMVCEATGWILGEAWIPRPDGSGLEPSPSWHAAEGGLEGFRAVSERTVFAPGVGLPGRVWSSKRPAWIPDVTEDPNFPRAPAAREAGLRAAVGVPVLAGDEVVAVLDFYVRDVREEEEASVTLIAAVAAQLGVFIRRKQAEEQLRDSEEKYRVLVEDLPAIPYVDRADESMETIYVGPQIEEILGVTQEEYLSDPHLWERNIHPDDRQRALDTFYEFVRTDAATDYLEYRWVRPDGRIVWINDRAAKVPGTDGQVLALQGVMFDVTERVRTERGVRLLESLSLAIAEAPTLDEALGTTLRMVCEATGWILGEAWIPRPDGSALDPSPSSYASEGGLEGFRAVSERTVFAPGVGVPGRVWASKRPAWIPDVSQDPNFPRAPAAREVGLRTMFGVPVLAGDEVVAVMDFFVRDVREEEEALVALVSAVAAQLGSAVRRKQAEEQLRDSEEKYRVLVEDLPAIPYVDRADESMETIYVGPQIEEILGVSQEEYLTDPHLWERHIHAEDRQRALDTFYEFVRTDAATDYLEYRWVRPDGRVVWINDRTVKVRDASGRVLMLQGVMFDVTQRKEAEEALRESEARFRTLVEQIPAAFHISGLDETASTIYMSPQIEDILGYAPEEWVADPELWVRLLHPDDRERALAVNHHHVGSGEPMSEDYRMIARDDRVVWIHDESVVMRDEQGRPLCTQGILLDITERKEAEEVLRASEAELGHSLEVLRQTEEERRKLLSDLVSLEEEERRRMAEGIQDESLQHMAAVGIRLEALRRSLSDPAQLGAIDKLGKSVEQAVDRLRNLLIELRPRTLDRDGLGAALRQYLESVAPEAGFAFTVDDHQSQELPLGTRAVAYRIAVEVIANVRDHAKAREVEVDLREREGGVLVQVIDDGVGFDPVAIGSAGLAAVRERAELAGGWLRVRSAPGAGTDVEFWLPRSRGGAWTARRLAGWESPPGSGSGTSSGSPRSGRR